MIKNKQTNLPAKQEQKGSSLTWEKVFVKNYINHHAHWC